MPGLETPPNHTFVGKILTVLWCNDQLFIERHIDVRKGSEDVSWAQVILKFTDIECSIRVLR